MNLPVAILAGGLATRLYPLTEKIPKSLLEVAGRPFIFHQIELLRRNGIRRIFLCVGYLGEKIQQSVGDGRVLGVHVEYVFDGPKLLGTGGALKKAVPVLGDAFFVLYGDSYLDINYREVGEVFGQSGKLGLMTVFRNEGRWDSSNVLLKEGRILAYDKRHPTMDMQYIDYGLGVLRKEAFDEVPPDRPYDLADVYRALVAHGELVGFQIPQRFYEIGSPAGLEETSLYLRRKG